MDLDDVDSIAGLAASLMTDIKMLGGDVLDAIIGATILDPETGETQVIQHRLDGHTND